MEQAKIQSHIEYHEKELARYRMTQAQHLASQSMAGQAAGAAAVNAQSHAEMLRNTDKSGNQLTGSAQPERRKPDDTELRKIALAHGVVNATAEAAVRVAALYLTFLKGDPPAGKPNLQQEYVRASALTNASQLYCQEPQRPA